MLLDAEEFFNSLPHEVRKGWYVVVENKGTIVERVLCAYESEIESYRVVKRCSTKCKVIKADVTYIVMEGLKILYRYKEIEKVGL